MQEEPPKDVGPSVSDIELSPALPPDGNRFKPSNPAVNFHGQKRTNGTYWSQTDPEAKLYRKG
jgi:hypothetical protein